MTDLLLLATMACVPAQQPLPPPREADATTPGVTVWVYDLGDPLTQDRRPTVAEGQTPNHFSVASTIDFKDGFDTAFGRLTDTFAGEVRGWITIDRPGDYLFRLHCDDGAALILDGEVIVDTELPPAENFSASGGATLAAGRHTLHIPFYEDSGKFSLRLEWKPPGAARFERVPTANLLTGAGQTFATSPGPKRWFYGRDPNRPGDGRPLESVHPSFTLENFRGPDFRPPVGGMAFLPDGRLAVCTWDPIGAVYILGNLDGKAEGGVTVTRFASGLGEPLGIVHWKGDLYITQKQEVTRLRDLDGDGVADEYLAIAAGWPASHNYHEFSFNLVALDDQFFLTTSVPLKSGDTNYTPGSTPAYAVGDGPGSAWSIDPLTGKMLVIGRGLRAPNGMGFGPDGGLFCCDNQGCWLPASRLNHIRRDTVGFYGHQTEPNGTTQADPPVCWFPHGEIGNSPTEPILVRDGPYARQLLIGDVTHGGINRVFTENVDGKEGGYQGCVFQFSQGLEAGVNRLAWGPDGCLYVGGIGADGNWHHKNKRFGLQRLRPNGHIPFEMLKVESRADGFLITFTQPVPESVLTNVANYEAHSWRYRPTVEYGGPKIDSARLPVSRVEASQDRRAAFVRLKGLKPDTVVYIRLHNFKNDRDEVPFTTEAWYTLNTISGITGPGFAQSGLNPAPTRPANALALFDGTAASLANFIHTDAQPCRWKIENGELLVDPSAQINTGGDLVTREDFGDCLLHVEWFCPPGGSLARQTNANSGVKLQSRYEVQVMGSPSAPHPPKFNEAGAIYRQKAADINASLGAGVWQSYDIRFRAPRWDASGRKTENARMTVWWNGRLVHNDAEVKDKTGASAAEAGGEHPLLLQSHPSDANGPVRFRNIWVVRE